MDRSAAHVVRPMGIARARMRTPTPNIGNLIRGSLAKRWRVYVSGRRPGRNYTLAKCNPNHFFRSNQVWTRWKPALRSIFRTVGMVYL